MKTILKDATLVLPNRVWKTNLVIKDAIISYIGDHPTINEGDQILSLPGKYILPGFIDIHNHGAMGFDFSYGNYMAGTRSFEKTQTSFEEGLTKFLQFNLQTGTTRTLLTTMAAPKDDLLESMGLLHQFLKTSGGYFDALVAGINVEGSFIKTPEFAGAQNSAWFYPPEIEMFEQLNSASGERIKIVNVPPEHGEHGLELIRYLKEKDVVIAAGHSGAYGAEVKKAIDSGLSLAVHFLNGPSRSSTKPFLGGGAVQEMLRADDIAVELIVDGYHIAPAYVRDVIRRKGVDRCIAITDSMFMNGLKNLTDFEMGGLKGCLSENGSYLHIKNQNEALFGSVLTMQQAFTNLLNWLTQSMAGYWYREHSALSFETVLLEVSKMCSGNAAKQIGIYASNSKNNVGTGSIEVGKSADILITNIQRVNDKYELRIDQAILNGKFI